MRDPHVERLRYEIRSGPGISYKAPPDLRFANDLGSFLLRDDILTFEPAEHFPTEREARVAVEGFLRGWEIHADLTTNFGQIRFDFQNADVVDRKPPGPGEPQVLSLEVGEYVLVGEHVSPHIGLGRYPSPPRSFSTTPDLEHAYRRWVGCLQSKESLQNTAYFVLTLLESRAGNRREAAKRFAIDRSVLGQIGNLSSSKGGPDPARKASRGAAFVPLTSAEEAWLQQAVRLLVNRIGEYASGNPLSKITFSDLPNL